MSTAHLVCAPRALRPEDAPVRLVPPHVLAASPLDADAIVPTLYHAEDFAALYHADKDRALALVAAMTEPQRVRQALAYCAWLAYHGDWRSTSRPCWRRGRGRERIATGCSGRCWSS